MGRYMCLPARCPACGGWVTLIVGTAAIVTTQFHNVNNCNAAFYYRCWKEEGFPLPRVEFFSPANALPKMLLAGPGEDYPAQPKRRYLHAKRNHRDR